MDNRPRLKAKYEDELRNSLKESFGIKNVMSIPRITKIVINSGLGEAKNDHKLIDDMLVEMGQIAGQKPVVTKARKSISNFKLREGLDIGVKVTLRNDYMWYFLDRLIAIVLPRIKDFRGIPTKAFDKNGNYSLGIKEHTVFPEIDPAKVSTIKSLQVVICTDSKDDKVAFELLKQLGMPFKKI
jgi:large subunit ribosomal protein L5